MISVKEIYKSYNKGAVEVLKGVSVDIPDGQFAVILGASGSGKSTALNIVSGLEYPDSGSVFYNETDICGLSDKELTVFRRKNIGFIFQRYYLMPHLSVDKNVRLGADLASNKDYKDVINAVGLSDKLKNKPYELSGGEQQRVCIARALAKKPNVLFADEPTGALDEATGRSVLDYMIRLKNELNYTLIMVTHNNNIAETADRVIKMNSGRIVDDYPIDTPKSAYEIGW